MDQQAGDGRRMALLLIEAIAPQELQIFDEVWASAADKRVRQQYAHPLASGVGDSWAMMQLLSPCLIAVSSWLLKDIVAKAASDMVVARIKTAVEAWLAQDAAPVHGPIEMAAIPAIQRQLIKELAAKSAVVAQNFGARTEHTAEIEKQMERLLLESVGTTQSIDTEHTR